jgi:peptidoglycan/xylan/chitin deacetylase (PgdA/CDA1 family)
VIELVIGHVKTPCGRVVQRQYRSITTREYYRLARGDRDTAGTLLCFATGEPMQRALSLSVTIAILAAGLVAGVRGLARSRTVQLFTAPASRVAIAEPVVALTFDDGPAPERLDTLLSMLRARDVHATFFLIGASIASAPLAARTLAENGHELGNHTYTHGHMVLHGVATYRHEVERTDSLLRDAGARGPIYFRPPYGYKLVGLPYALWRMGRTTVTWDIEPESYPHDTNTPAKLVRHVLDRVRPGSIILLHPWYASGANTRAAIPVLIDSLRARGYRVTTVGELIARARQHQASPPP